VISGFGGKKLPTETNAIVTALRETIEELFHVEDIDSEMIEEIISQIKPNKTIVNGTYHAFMYSLVDLECILYILRLNALKTPLYDTVPGTLADLILRRKLEPVAEVRDICLLPVNCTTICKSFAADIRLMARSHTSA
jgi:hypothetical protein